jgi:hypothetical protein
VKNVQREAVEQLAAKVAPAEERGVEGRSEKKISTDSRK